MTNNDVPNSGKFRIFLRFRTIREIFSAKFCGLAYIIIGGRPDRGTGAICESFLCEIFVLYRNAKVFSLEIFPLYCKYMLPMETVACFNVVFLNPSSIHCSRTITAVRRPFSSF